MKPRLLDAAAVRRALSIRDLTDPAAGPHAMQLLVAAILDALHEAWRTELRLRRASPIVTVEDNYDRLHYPPEGAARDARYTRYVTETTLLRTQASAMIPPLLRELADAPSPDVLLACPGVVYRRDCIDRLHSGEPHQMDLWRLRQGARLTSSDLLDMIGLVVGAALPGSKWRATPAVHPYTTDGLQIDVLSRGEWIEIGECGLANPALLDEASMDPTHWSGLAMGIGLDRILMLRKGLDDIRLLRSEDPRISAQMIDLAPYRPVSTQPPIRRDLSIAVAADRTPEELGDAVRAALGERSRAVETIEVVAETPADALPAPAASRLGIRPGQKNVLLRLVLRDLDRTLTSSEANVLRDDVYAALHEGDAWQWASGGIAQ